jgi:mitotic spindle assembly checkpoint protein MAD2
VTFNVLAYTDKDILVPPEWEDSDQKLIVNPCVVKLRSFSTDHHQIESLVSYAMDSNKL